jgi:hypothetical protein
MSNLGFELGWVSFITRNLTSWIKLILQNIRYLVLKIGGLIDALKDLEAQRLADDSWKV